MTPREARSIADDLLDGYSAMDNRLLSPGDCVRAMHVLEDEGRADIVNTVYGILPGLMFFDPDGGYNGPTSYENGGAA